MFGNERDGLSEMAMRYADGNFKVPQVGMVQSLNISVACAVTLYESYRQRLQKGFYDEHPPLSPGEQRQLLDEYFRRHEDKIKGEKVIHKNK